MKFVKRGFTLIELLIVIAIIGILATAILIALDPVEQTRRASDSGRVASSGEIKAAADRFFASKLYFPWCTAASAGTSCTYVAGCADGSSLFDDGGAGTSCAESVMTLLTSTGELKAAPPAAIAQDINLTLSGGGATFQMAFVPESKTMKTNYASAVGSPGVYTTTACTAIGTVALCPSTSTTCAYCVF